MKTTCDICPHACSLSEGVLGVCGTRTVQKSEIVSLSYGKSTALALDPIEKKPFARFHRGSNILSYGSFGCNLSCPFCQNSDIACARADQPIKTRYFNPAQLVELALKLQKEGNIGIAYTYNEPLIAWEYLSDVAKLAHENGLLNVAVTNGYISRNIWEQSLKLIDAFNIDLKCFTAEGYRSLGAPDGLKVVKQSIEMALKAGIHTEVTTLVVPGLSDNVEKFTEECKWLASLDPETPLHITRFFPCHKEKHKKPTDLELLERFYNIAERYLKHVFLGNV